MDPMQSLPSKGTKTSILTPDLIHLLVVECGPCCGLEEGKGVQHDSRASSLWLLLSIVVNTTTTTTTATASTNQDPIRVV